MKARLLSWTVVRVPPPGHPKDRVVALVEREDGARTWAVAEDDAGFAVDAEVEVEDGAPARVVGRGG